MDRTRYVSTVDLATSIPGFRNSPTIRGEPQPGLAADILRINALISSDTVGLPADNRLHGSGSYSAATMTGDLTSTLLLKMVKNIR